MQPPPTAPTPGRPAPRREISRRWFAVFGGFWIVVLLVAGWWGLAGPELTDRQQMTVAQAQPYVDEAIARVGAAIAADGGVVAIGRFSSVGSCSVTAVRTGDRYQRVLDAFVPPGSELDMLTRVAGALPEGYKAVVSRGGTPGLTADAGGWVLLTGSVTDQGEIRFVADTGLERDPFGHAGCRPLGDLAEEPVDPDSAWASGLLGQLGLTVESVTSAKVSCVDGGFLTTSEVRAGAYRDDLERALAAVPGGDVVVSGPQLYAFVASGTQFAVRADGDATIVTATTTCQ